MKSFVRISALLWADILVAYALFVLQKYLTDVWKLSFTHAAGFLNVWSGIYLILPGFILFLVDAFLGNFTILVISSIAYSLGITFVTLSTPTFLGPCKDYKPECIGPTQKALFYSGMGLLTVGISGHNVSLKPFLEEQEDRPDEGSQVLAIIFAFMIVVIVPVTGAIALPYIKPWAIRFGIPAICTVFVTILFFTGCFWGKYHSDEIRGSPITNVFRVFVASAFNINKSFPDDNRQLHRIDDQETRTRTRFLRCLEKAAIKEENRDYNRWRLCSIGEVEEAKIAVRMVPMWLTFIVLGIVSSIGNTYFLEQASHMNRNIGKWKVPIPIFKMLFDYAKQFFNSVAGAILKPNKPRAPSIGLALAMIFSVLCCITAAKLETRRINVIISHGLLDKPDDEIPMSMFWLLFQFFLLGGVDSFFHKSVAAFYADQAPESMKEYLTYFSKGVSSLGFMCNVLSVYVVGKVSERGVRRRNWFQYTLNRSRLDRYYWFLATLSAVNLIVFIFVASFYRYKKRGTVDRELVDAEAEAFPQEEENDQN